MRGSARSRLIPLAVVLGALAASAEAQPAAKPKPAPALDALKKQASAAREQNRLEDAIPLYRKALQAQPSWTEGWWYLGASQYEIDQFAPAKDAFRKVVGADPKNAGGWAMLGLAEYQLREYEPALTHLQRARALGLPNDSKLYASVRYHSALLLNRFEQFEVAAASLNEIARAQPETPSLIEAAGLAVLRMPFLPPEIPPDKRELIILAGRAAWDDMARRPADAARGFEELAARFGETPNVNYAYGGFLLRADPDAALKRFARELEVSPNHVPARVNIAAEYLRRAEPAQALPYAAKAAEIAPGSFVAQNVYGRALVETGKLDEGAKALEKAVKLEPLSPEVRFALANAYSRLGRKDDATRERAEFRRLTELRGK